MKNLFVILLLSIIGGTAQAQIVENYVAQKFKNTVDSFSHTLDSTVKYQRTTSSTTVLNADTLLIPINTQVLFGFAIDAMNQASGDASWGQRSVLIENVKGVYKVAGIRSLDGSGFVGERTMAKASWTVSITNNLPILRLTGIQNTTINWSIRKTIL